MSLITLLFACAGPPTESLSWRESWELLGVLEDGSILDARVSVGNTGMLRGQGQMRLDRWSAHASPVRFARHAAPQEVSLDADRDAILFQDQGLARDESGRWALRLSTDALSAMVILEPSPLAVAPAAWLEGRGQWTAAAPSPGGRISGWLAAGEQGGLLRGQGLLLHRGGDGWPSGPRRGVYVLDASVRVGVDTHGEGALRWAFRDGQPLDAASLSPQTSAEGMITLDFRPAEDLLITVSPTDLSGESDPYESLLPPERWLAAAAGPSTRRLQAAEATIRAGGAERKAPALVLTVQ